MINIDIKVVELFAGVGGFRLGLENASKRFKTIWANQWEPNRKVQHAFECYNFHFGNSITHINENISKVKHDILPHDLLVGGFPCQDYSVARTQAKGIEGNKGILWWDIADIIKNTKPKLILLENVDRLLKSPTNQRGRDFGIMLKCFNDMGYTVEWRVINAADYGFAQRRRRVFIFAYINKNISNNLESLILEDGFFAKTFPVEKYFEKYINISDFFSSPFYNSGAMINGVIYSINTTPKKIKPITLNEIRHKNPVDEQYFLSGSLDKWTFLKGAKKIPRKKPNGDDYYYSEGGMKFPDDLNSPARTILTSESSVNRSSHVIHDYVTGKLRTLTPIECERLNGFPDDWTNTGMPHKYRYFVMGNSLVVPLITMIGKAIIDYISFP